MDETELRRLMTRVTILEDSLRFVLGRMGVPDELLGKWIRETRSAHDMVYIHVAINNAMATIRDPSPLDD